MAVPPLGRYVGGLLMVLLLPLSCRVALGEVMRWRYPGVTGLWLDPHNWVGQTSGLPRVPGPNDDVVLTGFNVAYGSHYFVTLQSRGGPITIRSLAIGSSTCETCNKSATYYYYNSTGSLWRAMNISSTGLGFCAVSLRVIAPTALVITNAFTIFSNGAVSSQLQLNSISNKLSWRSSITAGSWNLGGEVHGSGDLHGSVVVNGALVVATILPDGKPPSTAANKPGTIQIFGNLNAANARLGFHVDYNLRKYSRLIVSQQITWPDFAHIYSAGTVDNTTYPVISFNTTASPGVELSFVSMGTYTGIAEKCPTNPSYYYYYYVEACSQTSAHDLSTLLTSLYGECCPNGFTGYPQCNIPTCPGTPPCNNRGSCNPPECICQTGWKGFACEIPSCPGSPVQCSGNGECFAPLPLGSQTPYCNCRNGWIGNDCSIPQCPNNCTDADHGSCNTQGNTPKCICKPGYKLGPNLDCAEQIPECPGLPEQCSGHGTCSNSTCFCSTGWTGADCSLAVCPNACNHHGVCVANATMTGTKCNCDPGWSGNDCSVVSCNGGAGCSGHGHCSSDLDPPRCICNGPTVLPTSAPPSPAVAADYGWTGPACANGSIPVCSFSKCQANGGTCGNQTTGFSCLVNTCPPGRVGWDCAEYFCADTGFPECSGHGNCNAGGPSCVCRPGYSLGPNNDCQFATCELNGCSNRGTCRTDLATPTCACDPYYYGADCSVGTCPGYPEKCSGILQGECLPNGTCLCTSDWIAEDCSVPRCPSTNGINCNDHGDCNSTSYPFFCECYEGFVGDACEKAVCPNDCSGHGICDATLSPPACRCDPYYGNQPDCSEREGTGELDEEQPTVIYALTAAGLGSMGLLVAGAMLAYYIWKAMQRRKMRRAIDSLHKMQEEMTADEPL